MKKSPVSLTALVIVLSCTAAFAQEKLWKVSFEDKVAEQKWTLKELNAGLPSDWSEFGFLVLEMRASSPQRFSLWIHTANGKRRLMLQPFGQNVWLRASVPLQYFKSKDQRGMDLASTNSRDI